MIRHDAAVGQKLFQTRFIFLEEHRHHEGLEQIKHFEPSTRRQASIASERPLTLELYERSMHYSVYMPFTFARTIRMHYPHPLQSQNSVF
jgi:hypothetical protein